MDYVRFIKIMCYDKLIVGFLIAVLCRATSGRNFGDECDWTGSGLKTALSEERGVTPVYLRCSAGTIAWLYPRGALRVLLRLPGGDRDFRACIKVRAAGDHRKPPARLYLEGPRSLLHLYANNDGSAKSIRCFNSKNYQAAIYVEAEEDDGVEKSVFEVEYDLQSLPRGSHAYDPSEECRPCTNEELAHAFCTSDLVTRGTIDGVENFHDEELSQMSIKVTKLIRRTEDDDVSYDEDIKTNAIPIDDVAPAEKITLYVSQRCGVSHGVGEFIFMARRKLGDLTLQCAPRLEDWAHISNMLTKEGKAHCVLRS